MLACWQARRRPLWPRSSSARSAADYFWSGRFPQLSEARLEDVARVSLIAQPECAVGGERFCSDAEQHCDGRLPMMPQVLGWDSAVRFGRDSRIHATERKRRREERRLLRLVPAPVPAARPLRQVLRLDR
jgi:hypothetical protein